MINNPVRAVREALNLSQFGMARKLHATMLDISKWEHNGTMPTYGESLARFREAAIQAGFGWQDDPPPPSS